MAELRVYTAAGTLALCIERAQAESLKVCDLKPKIRATMGLEAPPGTWLQVLNGQLILLCGSRTLDDEEKVETLWPLEGPLELQVVVRSLKTASEMLLEDEVKKDCFAINQVEVSDSGEILILQADCIPRRRVSITEVIDMSSSGSFHCSVCDSVSPSFRKLMQHLRTARHVTRYEWLDRDFHPLELCSQAFSCHMAQCQSWDASSRFALVGQA